MRWAGIDEAGYGPNLGPLVMTAVVAEGPGNDPPDLWSDLGPAVSRAGGPVSALWIDDSKRIYRAGQGRARLEAAALAVLLASQSPTLPPRPSTLGQVLEYLGAGSLADAELDLWLPTGEDPPVPSLGVEEFVSTTIARFPLAGATWRIVGVRSVVMGPSRFQVLLARTGSKGHVHFSAFGELLGWIWNSTGAGEFTRIRGDKHGGRHYYLAPLQEALPATWIEPGPEGPLQSLYRIREGDRRLELELRPRADAEDGLVALASIVSKAVREWWMSAFNAHWATVLPDLKPTAGYPRDAARFREAIETHCQARGLATHQWWRAR